MPGWCRRRALGLGRWQTLWLVELPLARPAILQGLNQAIS
jgi:glycine betaine/proline transport system permease protein